MKRIAGILVVALIATLAAVVPASAGTYKWTPTLCVNASTDTTVRVCTQVRHYSYGDGSHKPVAIYVYWSPTSGAIDLDNMQILNGGSWRWVGSGLRNFTVYNVSGVRTYDSRCYLDYDVDGFLNWNDYSNTAYHQCW